MLLHAMFTSPGLLAASLTLSSRAFRRITVPAQLLSAFKSLEVYVAVCDASGVVEVVDSGQLLVLPPDAAEEVQLAFQNMVHDVQDAFGSHLTFVNNDLRPAESLFVDVLPRLRTQQLNSAGAMHSTVLHAYQHLLMPVIRLTAVVLQSADDFCNVSSSSREAAALLRMANFLMDFLVDNNMYQTAMYVFSQLPFSMEETMNSLSASDQRAFSLGNWFTLQLVQQHTAESLQDLRLRSRVLPILNLEEQHTSGSLTLPEPTLHTPAPQTTSRVSVASADDMLRQLQQLQLARHTQEAADRELLPLQQQLDTAHPQQYMLQDMQQRLQDYPPARAGSSHADQQPSGALERPGDYPHPCKHDDWSPYYRQQQQAGASVWDAHSEVQQHGGLDRGSEGHLASGSTPAAGLDFLQQQPEHALWPKTAADQLEGYLQLPRCIQKPAGWRSTSTSSNPAAAGASPAAAQTAAAAVRESPRVYRAHNKGDVRQLWSKSLSFPAAATAAAMTPDAQLQESAGEHDSEPLVATVGSTVAEASDQRIQLLGAQLQQQVCPADAAPLIECFGLSARISETQGQFVAGEQLPTSWCPAAAATTATTLRAALAAMTPAAPAAHSGITVVAQPMLSSAVLEAAAPADFTGAVTAADPRAAAGACQDAIRPWGHFDCSAVGAGVKTAPRPASPASTHTEDEQWTDCVSEFEFADSYTPII